MKHWLDKESAQDFKSPPRTGAWIETKPIPTAPAMPTVAPSHGGVD